MDPELDRLIREETLEKSLRLTLKLAALAEQLAHSLDNAARTFDRLAKVPAQAARRRSDFRREECPGRFA
jgi:septal ring factor EnvC (AmiA/AmiB activator)